MHINLNNQADQFLQLSPILGRADQGAPSPLLSPDPLFFIPNSQPEMPHFRLQNYPEEEQPPLLADCIDNLSSPMPYLAHLDAPEKSSDHSSNNLEEPLESRQPVRRRKQPKSTKLIPSNQEQLPPLIFPDKDLPPIRAIIEFLVENSSQPERELLEKGRSLFGESQIHELIFSGLVGKFKKLKKTKQQMTKYCMRKVFKFIADHMRKDRTHNRDVDSCMKLYFAKNQTSSPFSIPFKKNSVEKTMNGNFLKRVFAFQTFANDYREFLAQFQALMSEDNEKKIIYLADVLEKCIRSNQLKKIESIKRLPWTREILMQTEQLAISLLSYTEKKQDVKDQ